MQKNQTSREIGRLDIEDRNKADGGIITSDADFLRLQRLHRQANEMYWTKHASVDIRSLRLFGQSGRVRAALVKWASFARRCTESLKLA